MSDELGSFGPESGMGSSTPMDWSDRGTQSFEAGSNKPSKIDTVAAGFAAMELTVSDGIISGL